MSATCLNCQQPRPGWNRFFCSDNCRWEYHHRGMKPRPAPGEKPLVKRIRAKHCQMCGKALSGKQRQWCADACRKKAVRLLKNVRELKESPDRSCPGMSGYLGDKVGERKRGTLVIRIEAVQTAEYLDMYHPIIHLKMHEIREKLAKVIEAELNREVFGHVVFVEVGLT